MPQSRVQVALCDWEGAAPLRRPRWGQTDMGWCSPASCSNAFGLTSKKRNCSSGTCFTFPCPFHTKSAFYRNHLRPLTHKLWAQGGGEGTRARRGRGRGTLPLPALLQQDSRTGIRGRFGGSRGAGCGKRMAFSSITLHIPIP